MSILDRIVAAKRQEIPGIRAQLHSLPQRTRPRYSLTERMDAGRKLALIAEIKRGSPSRGLFSPDLDVAAQAAHYEASGASALSVLTDSRFWGSYGDLSTVTASTALPILAKDFIVDPSQVTTAHALGADVILLIAAVLSPAEIDALSGAAQALGMEVILEVHADEAFNPADIPEGVILGINGRNLHSFETELKPTLRAIDRYRSAARHLIAESGIHEVEQAQAAARAGFSGILVGESLVRDGTGGLARRLSSVMKEGAYDTD